MIINKLFSVKLCPLKLHEIASLATCNSKILGRLAPFGHLVSFSCVCPVIDNEFGHNIVKLAVDPQLLRQCYDETHDL